MAFVRETLRMFPTIPRLPRNVHADTVLPGTYFTPESKHTPIPTETGKFLMAIPAGSNVVIDIWAVHMNRKSCTSRTEPIWTSLR